MRRSVITAISGDCVALKDHFRPILQKHLYKSLLWRFDVAWFLDADKERIPLFVFFLVLVGGGLRPLDNTRVTNFQTLESSKTSFSKGAAGFYT